MSLNPIGHGMMQHSSTMHQTVKAALIPTGAYFVTQIRNRLTWSVVIATIKIQVLERVVPPLAGIVYVKQAGARCVSLSGS